MNSPFIFSREVINDAFVGRRDELSWLASNLSNRQNTVLIAPFGYGKKSLVRNAFIQAKKQIDLKLCTCNLFNIRDEQAFYTHLAYEVLNAACATADEWRILTDKLMPFSQPTVVICERKQPGIQLVFDPSRLQAHVGEVLQLAERIATQQQTSFIIWLNDFQEIAHFDKSESFQKRLVAQWKQQHQVGYVLSSSKTNAMHNLVAHKRPFHDFGEIIEPEPVEERLFIDYIIKSFSKSGRVISRDFAETICRTTRTYPFYTQQYAHLCWLNTQGFVNESMLENATTDLLNHNERLFRILLDSLSPSQINYLEAMCDQVERFSSAKAIERYQLHSSANIMRARTGLEKKEIIRVIRGKPVYIDPIFKLWMKKRYFNRD